MSYNLLKEASFGSLLSDTKAGFPKTKKRHRIASRVRVNDVQFVVYAKNNKIKVTATCKSMEHGSLSYSQVIVIENVEFVKSGTLITDTSGKQYSIKPVTHKDIKVRCNCQDFLKRFSKFNDRDGSLVGVPDNYIPKPGSNRPPANPNEVPGLCKHLIKVIRELKKLGIVL